MKKKPPNNKMSNAKLYRRGYWTPGQRRSGTATGTLGEFTDGKRHNDRTEPQPDKS